MPLEKNRKANANQEKIVFIFSESHHKPIENEMKKAAMALIDSKKFGKVKVFFESQVNQQEARRIHQLNDLDIGIIEDPTILKYTNLLISSCLLAEFDAFLWSIYMRDENERTKQFLDFEIRLRAKAEPESVDNRVARAAQLKTARDSFQDDCLYTADSVLPEGELNELFIKALKSVVKFPPTQPLMPEVVEFLKKGLEGFDGEEIAAMGKLAGLISDFFSKKYGKRLNPPKEYGCWPKLAKKRVISNPDWNDPIALYNILNEEYNKIRMIREMYMAYKILTFDFNIGLLNIGSGHVSNGNIVPLLQQGNVKVVLKA